MANKSKIWYNSYGDIMEKTNELKKLLIFIFIVVIVFAVFYGLTMVVIKNKKNIQESEQESTTIQYEQIMIGNMYKQNDEQYYVLIEMPDDKNITSYERERYSYISKDDSLKMYIADLSNAFNKKYIGSSSNFDEKFPIFSQSTILKIENDSIVEIYEGSDQINDFFSRLNSEQE